MASICDYNTLNKESPFEFFLKILSENLFKISGKQSMQYLNLFCNLIDEYK